VARIAEEPASAFLPSRHRTLGVRKLITAAGAHKVKVAGASCGTWVGATLASAVGPGKQEDDNYAENSDTGETNGKPAQLHAMCLT